MVDFYGINVGNLNILNTWILWVDLLNLPKQNPEIELLYPTSFSLLAPKKCRELGPLQVVFVRKGKKINTQLSPQITRRWAPFQL